MIDAKELRIGNWIIVNGGDDYSTPQNYEIDAIDIGVSVNCPERFSPIPLTPEILEKCGFIQDGNGNMWIDLITHYLEFILGGEDYYYPVYASLPELSSEAEQRVNLNSIKYVHQLQNLYFALTGHELEYKI